MNEIAEWNEDSERETPRSVRLGVKLLWFSIATSATSILLQRLSGEIDDSQFVFDEVVAAIYCVFPYRIGLGSNAMRVTWGVLTVFGFIMWIGGSGGGMTQLSWVVLALNFAAAVYLFSRDSSAWFRARTRT